MVLKGVSEGPEEVVVASERTFVGLVAGDSNGKVEDGRVVLCCEALWRRSLEVRWRGKNW